MNRPSLILPTGRLRPLSVLLAVAVLVGAVATSAVSWATGLSGDAAMRVDGQEISISELDRRIDVLSAIYGVTAPEDGESLDEFRRTAAKSLAVSTVLEGVADDRGVDIATKTLQDELTKIIEGQPDGDRATFVDFLGQKGLTEDDVIGELRRARETQRLYAEVTKPAKPATKADAQQEYDSRRDEIKTPEKRRFANIVVATKDEADQVLDRLRKGEEFAGVASATSLDASTAQAGGDLGQEVDDTQVEPAYAEAAFGVAAGELFGPVQTESGWNVGKVLKVTPGQQLTYEQVEATLLSAITSRRQLELWTEWLNDRIDDADVEYAEGFQPDDERVTTVEANQQGSP